MNLLAQAQELPRLPGCYLLRDKTSRVLYVGKALRLRDRVRSYFQGPISEPKVAALRRLTAEIEVILTATEAEALLLEETLIKLHRPKYNVLLRDDKHYPYLRLADEPFPRLEIVRQRKADNARYFGPYPGGAAVHETLRLMARLFPMRACSDHKFKTVDRPCLLYHIKRCPAPCVGLISSDDYQHTVSQASTLLEGRHEEVMRALRQEMAQAAAATRYEAAAQARDRLRAVEAVTANQTVVVAEGRDTDVFALAQNRQLAVVDVLLVRHGKLTGRKRYTFQIPDAEQPAVILATALRTHYGTETPPRTVWMSALPEGVTDLRAWVRQRRQGPVTVAVPSRGDGRRMVQMAAQNAAEGLRQEEGSSERAEAALAHLADALSLAVPPRRIEAYDISNTQGTLSVAAMTVAEDGVVRPSHFRQFSIRTVSGANDFASLQEAISRRLGRLDDRRDTSFRNRPDLLLIDGGKGQVTAVIETLSTLDQEIAVVGLAKREEWLYVPQNADAIILPRHDPGLQLLQQLRDEAHRFANTAHGNRRSRAMTTSWLDLVPGIGPKRKRLLLKTFGSPRKIQAAAVEDLIQAGLPAKLAVLLKEASDHVQA
ncbi:MAG: excinuclease ABC subunit UvrC [Sulfobacillus sp.]